MCKDCKGITLLKGEDGVGIVNIVNNPNGTITVLLSNGTSYTTTSLIGPVGPQGAYGGWSSNWLYNTATTNTPATTTMRFDTVSPAAATKIYINQVNAAGTTISDFLDSFKNTKDGINYYGFLKIYRETSQEDDFLYVKITGYSLASGVATIDITQLVANGSFTANDSLVVDFTFGPTDFRPYKVYSALISQNGTAAPVAKVLENTIGAIVWTRTSAGTYSGTLTGAFTASKTFSQLTLSLTDPQVIGYTKRNSDDVVAIRTYDPLALGRDSTLVDASLEIRVYN